MPHLFDPLVLRSLTLQNRLVVSPMCQYSSVDGFSNDWHFVHLGSRAVGGAALVFTEATAVTAAGRISPQDLGIYDEGHVAGLARIVRFIHAQKTLAGIQLAHAGRKASTRRPWEPPGEVRREDGGWEAVAPTNEPFAPNYRVPCLLWAKDIGAVVAAVRPAALSGLHAGVADAKIPLGPGYQVPFAEHIRREAGIPTGAVGLITDAAQAHEIVASGKADCVLMARELLRDPYFPLRAARELGHTVPWPPQYLRAAPQGAPPR